MGRSILAIVVGFLLIAALSFSTDAMMRSALPEMFDANGRTDNLGMLIFSIAYVGVYAIAGCWVAARLAPKEPMKHALILGLLGLVFNIVGASVMWESAPVWYHVLSIALTMPFAWVGGRIREQQLAQ
jgi:hypothetical protein